MDHGRDVVFGEHPCDERIIRDAADDERAVADGGSVAGAERVEHDHVVAPLDQLPNRV